jgi:hypothetical protein
VLERPPTLQIDDEDDRGFINKSTCAIIETPLVVGGEPARIKEFPHMVIKNDTPTYYATIICHIVQQAQKDTNLHLQCKTEFFIFITFIIVGTAWIWLRDGPILVLRWFFDQ